MLHHLSFAVSDLDRSGRFYDAALGPLGYARVWSDRHGIGYAFWVEETSSRSRRTENVWRRRAGFHLAFAAASRQAVDAWHAAAIAAGGTDYGKPGLRPQYGPDYYAAFVYDPDGYAIEAVTKA